MQSVDAVIREATQADAEALGRMHWAAWREAYSGLLPAEYWTPEGESARIEGWRRDLEQAWPGSLVVLGIRDAQVVGCAGAGPSKPNPTAGAPLRDQELHAIYVRESEYGSGLSSRLLETVLPQATPAQLWVFEANPRARAFYAKHGFAPDGARHVFGPDLGDQPEIRLVR